MLSAQTSCKDTGRNMRTSVCDDCRDTGEHKYRIGTWAKSPEVVRRRFVLCASANPFNVEAKAFWPKSKDELKSKTTIFSRNLLYFYDLQQFSKTLTGQ
jgi:hypothetical protein